MSARGHKWLIVRAATAAWQRFWHEAKAIPAEAWRRWASTLAVGLGLCALIMFVTTRWAMTSESLQVWDERTLIVVTQRFPMSFDKGVTWQSPGNLLGMMPVVVAFAALTSWFARPLIAATTVATYVLQFAIVWVGWGLWNRDRPDLIADGLAAPGLHSFPSGHAFVITTVYGLLFYLWFRASRSWLERLLVVLFALVWIGLISASRLVLGAHWPSDVIAGLAIAPLWLVVVIVAITRAEAYIQQKR
ncbi:MAG: phosphatase PAP2 family protein [Leptolyngbya sp. SIO4C1]|nr:phosphatase PAP2 family protein [Leptolyngbya sp. SIO4C1]